VVIIGPYGGRCRCRFHFDASAPSSGANQFAGRSAPAEAPPFIGALLPQRIVKATGSSVLSSYGEGGFSDYRLRFGV
jgi:hypothetical protein